MAYYSSMKKLLCVLFCAAALSLAAGPDVTGKWSGTFVPDSGDQGTAYLVLKQAGTTVTGTAGPDAGNQWVVEAGKIGGNKLTFQVTDPGDKTVYKCTLTMDAHHMTGEVEVSNQGQTMKGKLDITKAD